MILSKKIKLAMIGIGNVATSHLKDLQELAEYEVVALCGTQMEKVKTVAALYSAKPYDDFKKMYTDSGAELVIIATPHGTHAEMAIAAFEAGLHVIVEKPLASNVEDARRTIDAYEKRKKVQPDLIFAGMFQFRTHGAFIKMREMLLRGSLGKLTRVTWTITNWYRTQAYFDSAAWRGTWKGEGGGVLINQNNHVLDMYQWLFGMPEKLMALCSHGKYHRIEVEDEATVFFQHANGMIGHLITSTAESPGVNRLEIAGELGLMTFEDNAIKFFKNEASALEQIYSSDSSFVRPQAQAQNIPFDQPEGSLHKIILKNVAQALLGSEPLIVLAEEGYHSLELANAAILSSHEKSWTSLPIDPKRYSTLVENLAKNSVFKKSQPTKPIKKADLSDSFVMK